MQLRSITGFRELKSDRSIDLEGTQAPILNNVTQQDDDYFSQELQLAYESGHLNVIGGLYYFRSEEHTSEFQSLMRNLVCRLLLENNKAYNSHINNSKHMFHILFNH